jgi:hypothetical protein
LLFCRIFHIISHFEDGVVEEKEKEAWGREGGREGDACLSVSDFL